MLELQTCFYKLLMLWVVISKLKCDVSDEPRCSSNKSLLPQQFVKML